MIALKLLEPNLIRFKKKLRYINWHVNSHKTILIKVNFQILTTIFICQIALREGAPVEFCIVQMGMAPSITKILDRFITGGANSIQTRQDVATMRPWWRFFTLLSTIICGRYITQIVLTGNHYGETVLKYIFSTVVEM